MFPLHFHFSANLPPTLAKSQVSSVRKNLKLHLVAVLKHPCSLEFHGQISTLLLDLGMPQSEITRSTPVPREQRKRPRQEQYTEGKKVKMGEWFQANLDPRIVIKLGRIVNRQSALQFKLLWSKSNRLVLKSSFCS